jgi:2'-5' RNA ligase
MTSPATPELRRLFLALWPEAVERRQMAELAASVAGRRRVRDANLHLTLAFLGATDPARLAAYEAALADLAVPALELVLDRYGYWPAPQILWLGSSGTPPELYELVADLHRRSRPTSPWPASFPDRPQSGRPSRRSAGRLARWSWSSRWPEKAAPTIGCCGAGRGLG